MGIAGSRISRRIASYINSPPSMWKARVFIPRFSQVPGKPCVSDTAPGPKCRSSWRQWSHPRRDRGSPVGWCRPARSGLLTPARGRRPMDSGERRLRGRGPVQVELHQPVRLPGPAPLDIVPVQCATVSSSLVGVLRIDRVNHGAGGRGWRSPCSNRMSHASCGIHRRGGTRLPSGRRCRDLPDGPPVGVGHPGPRRGSGSPWCPCRRGDVVGLETHRRSRACKPSARYGPGRTIGRVKLPLPGWRSPSS